MKRFGTKGRRGWRSVPALVATIIVAGAVLTPTVSGAVAFITKARAEKRYLNNTSVVKSTTTVPSGDIVRVTATCAPGLQAIGGGAESPAFHPGTTPGEAMVIVENKPTPTGPRPNAWEVEAANLGSNPLAISAVAVCSK